MQNRKTKIVCSLGPASSSDSVVRDLLLAGMNVARFNFSHGTHETHRTAIEQVRRISGELGVSVAIMLDTKGPEIRTGMTENNEVVTIRKDDAVTVTTDDCFTVAADGQTPARLSISLKNAASKLESGHHILVADGLLDLEVLNIENGVLNCKAGNTASIGSKKNVNLIGVHPELPIMSEQDKKDIAFGAELDIDFIAASFLSYPHEVTEIKKYLQSLDSDMKIIAKIENGEGIENIREITNLADGVMVARGDLGVQLPTERIPLAQKYIISVCRKIGKPVITATQMLESMVVNPRPTRAELTDVANAIFDGTDAVMLSGETANGAYPVESVKMMDKIACTVEQSPEFRAKMKTFHSECLSWMHNSAEDLGVVMSRSGVEIASAVGVKAIVTSTSTGKTARLLSAFRPDEPVIAVTSDRRAERVMQLYWGVSAFQMPRADETEKMIHNAMKTVSDRGFAGIADKVMLVAGLPVTSPYTINAIRVVIIGTVIARSVAGGFSDPDVTRAWGRIIHADTVQEAQKRIKADGGEILVCKTLTDDFIPVLSSMNGVICEGISEVGKSRLREINPRLVWLTNIRYTAEKLESGLTVTMDAKQLLVYEGSV